MDEVTDLATVMDELMDLALAVVVMDLPTTIIDELTDLAIWLWKRERQTRRRSD